jgi:hypothetical protein
MKPELRISIKDVPRNKTLKVLLRASAVKNPMPFSAFSVPL